MMNMIAFLNEEFRRTFHGGKVMMTMGVAELPKRVVAEALIRVANFSKLRPKRSTWRARLRELRARGSEVLLEDRLLRRRYAVRLRRSERSEANRACAHADAFKRVLNRARSHRPHLDAADGCSNRRSTVVGNIGRPAGPLRVGRPISADLSSDQWSSPRFCEGFFIVPVSLQGGPAPRQSELASGTHARLARSRTSAFGTRTLPGRPPVDL
ncbi:hypothetical protein ACVI1I_006233 [Bradyrhizobium sp. USDA 4459]